MNWNQTKPPIGSKIDWSHPLSKGIVGCWLFNENGGDKIFDLSLNRIIGNLTFSIYWVYAWITSNKRSGRGVMTFNGYAQSASLDLGNRYNFTTQDFTIIHEFRIDTFISPYGGIFSNGNYNTYGYFCLINPGGAGLTFFLAKTGQSTNISTNYIFISGKIYTLTITVNGLIGKIYVDGIDVTTGSSSFAFRASSSSLNLTLGKYISTTYAIPVMYHYTFIVYNRALSKEEILKHQIEPFCFIQ
jgi:hypothetical protein